MPNVKTKRGARKRYNALVNRLYRNLAGGTQFGIDMPTLAICYPDEYAELKHLKAIYSSLPA